jgi:hypothetical protein
LPSGRAAPNGDFNSSINAPATKRYMVKSDVSPRHSPGRIPMRPGRFANATPDSRADGSEASSVLQPESSLRYLADGTFVFSFSLVSFFYRVLSYRDTA